jgi:Ca-activated chloride channel family protein
MFDVHFANPSWGHGLWVVLALAIALLWLDARGRAALDRLLSVAMQQRLTQRVPRGRRRLSIALLALSATALLIAMMRPQGPPAYREMPRVGAQLMVCLDVSKSMLAEDTAPNRLERAKAELTDLLPYLHGDQVGLIAFAGKASVLCPLTPDFGFFRLILDAAGPQSVGRGGTRLEEPIRKALAGFRTEPDVSRVILLVTDGEDHDSYPLEAAKEAAARGIKIITIGFGDETGSEVPITAPETGVRSLLKDGEGRPVITRLDGETLRDIAMTTDGVYVPAGTGALDLESIYEGHIASLTRGSIESRSFSVRREYYQWAVLVGLALLVGSIAAASGAGAERPLVSHGAQAARRVATILAICVSAAVSLEQETACGQAPAKPPKPPANAASGGQEQPDMEKNATTKEAAEEESEQDDPRGAYNEALACLNTDADRAERLLTNARRNSGTDAEVRFRATFNLAWVEVHRADSLLDDNPEQALQHLRSAADWFRDAVRLRPEHNDSRHNLEVILRRIAELADSLRKQDDESLEQRLDTLIETQRGLVGQTGEIVDVLAADEDPNATQRFRTEFRGLAVQQRQVLSDGQALGESAREELESLEKMQEEERTPEQQMRAVQLNNVLHYLNRATQRLGMARSQLRRKQAERAFRRAATALDELKRARDQLRNPVEVLGVLIGDASQLAKLTGELANDRRGTLLAPNHRRESRAWLTDAYLADGQQSISERTRELAAQLDAAVQQATQQPAGPPTSDQQQQQAAEERTMRLIREAAPLVQQAATAMESAAAILTPAAEGESSPDEVAEELSAQQLDDVTQYQAQAIEQLLDARERFLDLKGLIELTHQDEVRIQSLLSVYRNDTSSTADHSLEMAKQLQNKNVDRGRRLGDLLDQAIAGLPSEADSDEATAAPQATEDVEAERKKLDLAQLYLASAQVEMLSAGRKLGELTGDTPPDNPPADGTPQDSAPATQAASDQLGGVDGCVARAVAHLSALRRLFYSVVEHLRETAQRQTQLNDDTKQVTTLQKAERLPVALGPLAARQQELQSLSREIAATLRQQSQQTPASATSSQGLTPEQQEMMKQAGERLAEASELVSAGESEMQKTVDAMNSDQPVAETITTTQDAALQKLLEALALLQPPQPQSENQQQPQEQPQDQQQSQAGADRLLQAVRDREAQRRKDRSRQSGGDEPVEKDW